MFYRRKKIDLANTNVIVTGNSLSSPNGIGSPTWADYLATRLNGTGCTFVNRATNGNTTDGMIGRQFIDVDGIFVPGKTNVLFFFEVSNGLLNGFSLQSEMDRYRTYCLNRKARGFKVLPLTCYDRIQGGNPALRTNLLLFNTWLRENYTGFSDGLVESWRVPQLGNASTFPDGVHPNGAFLDLLAEQAFGKLVRLSSGRALI
jgi:hypothetical protein